MRRVRTPGDHDHHADSPDDDVGDGDLLTAEFGGNVQRPSAAALPRRFFCASYSPTPRLIGMCRRAARPMDTWNRSISPVNQIVHTKPHPVMQNAFVGPEESVSTDAPSHAPEKDHVRPGFPKRGSHRNGMRRALSTSFDFLFFYCHEGAYGAMYGICALTCSLTSTAGDLSSGADMALHSG